MTIRSLGAPSIRYATGRSSLSCLTLLGGTMAAACAGSGDRHPVVETAWPATAEDVSLETELRRPADDPLAETAADGILPTDAPGVQVREIDFGGLYALEVILGDASFDDSLPMVVLLHGRGDRPRAPGGPFAHAPTPMRLVLPRAPDPLGSGFTWLSVSVASGRSAELASSLRARAVQLAGAIRDLSAARPTLGAPIVTGFSQGGLLAFALAVEHPDVVGEALPMAGWLPPELMPAPPLPEGPRAPIRSAHGTADRVIPFEPTRAVVDALADLGWDAVLVPFEGVEHVMSPEMNAQFEQWLEAALSSRAPSLVGGGLGEAGEEADAYAPFTPLDRETIDAIEAVEAAGEPPTEGVETGDP